MGDCSFYVLNITHLATVRKGFCKTKIRLLSMAVCFLCLCSGGAVNYKYAKDDLLTRYIERNRNKLALLTADSTVAERPMEKAR